MDLKQIYGPLNKILIVGTYPPPLGGISVFIYRLRKLLLKNNYEVEVFNTAQNYKILGAKFLAFILKILKGRFQVIHVQNFDLKRILVLVIFKSIKNYRIYFTDHNPFIFDHKSRITNWMIRKLFPKIDKLIVVNYHILENYKLHRIDLQKNATVCNAFIPPPLEDREKILTSYPADLNVFLMDHYPLILANAYQLKIVEGIDLYGFDMCLGLAKRLIISYPEVGFILCIADVKTNINLLHEILRRIEEERLTRFFYFLTDQKEIWPLYEKIQVFVRPTYRDGYGISIDEAIYFNCIAVASNACKRNPKAIIFENRNLNDFYEKCITAILRKGQYATN